MDIFFLSLQARVETHVLARVVTHVLVCYPMVQERVILHVLACVVTHVLARVETQYFFLWTTLPGRGRNMVRGKKCNIFFWPKFSDFGPKIRFLL